MKHLETFLWILILIGGLGAGYWFWEMWRVGMVIN